MTKDTKARPELGEVTWQDAHSPGSTEVVSLGELDKVHKPLIMKTVGWLLRVDKHGTTIAGEDCGDGDYRNVTFIPNVLITQVRPLKRPRKRKINPDVQFDGGITSALQVGSTT